MDRAWVSPKALSRDSRASLTLDFWRGFSAVMVLLFHARMLLWPGRTQDTLSDPFFNAVNLLFGRGVQFVMVFFVLSGFVISSSVLAQIRSDRFSWKTYLIHRLTRLWVVLIPSLLLTLVLLWADGQVRVVYEEKLTWDYFLGNLFFLQGILLGSYGNNAALWSLSYEFWFYLMFPCMVLCWVSKRWAFRLLYGIFFLEIATLIGQGTLWYAVWLLGSLVCWLPRRPVGKGRLWLGFLLFVGSFVVSKLMSPGDERDYGANLVVGLAFAAYIYLLVCSEQGKASTGVGAQWVRSLAGMSYTLYLIHFPVLWVVHDVTGRFPLSLWGLFCLLAVCFGVLLFAWLMSRVTEARTEAARDWVTRRVDGLFPNKKAATKARG